MQLLLTGATTFLAAQLDPSKSLGGYISSSEVQSGTLSNIFDTISTYTKQISNKKETRAIVIKNDSLKTYDNLKVWTVYPYVDDEDNSDSSVVIDTNITTIKLGYQAVTADACGDLSAQKLSTVYAIPYSVTLVEAERFENALSLPDIESGDYLALFIQRTINTVTPYTDDDLLEITEGKLIPSTIEDISLNFSWDEV